MRVWIPTDNMWRAMDVLRTIPKRLPQWLYCSMEGRRGEMGYLVTDTRPFAYDEDGGDFRYWV